MNYDDDIKNNEDKKGMSKGIIPKGRPKSKIETKQRISIGVYPTTYNDIKKIAFVQRKTVTQIINSFFEEYISLHQTELEQYENIKEEESI